MTTVPTINASEETFKLGPLEVRFLLTGEDTEGQVSIFEVNIPAGQKLPARTIKTTSTKRPCTASRVW